MIRTILHLDWRGEPGLIERFKKWLKDSESIAATEFIVENTRYCRKKISSEEFKDIIDEDSTEWMLIYSADREFEAIGKIITDKENLIGLKNEFIRTLWILKSNIETLKVEGKPIQIWSPHNFDSPLHRVDYDFAQLLTKLHDPKIELIEFVDYKISKTGRRRIR